jgi:putative DNA-invertase from lambdoid prophage Rac
MTMGVINAVAQFERDLLIERTQSGLKRAKAEGAVFGLYGAKLAEHPVG